MPNEIEVTFPGNLKVEAAVGDFTVVTDQPEKSGGDNTAPSPTEYFLVSIANCSAYFALKFCRTRDIDYSNMRLKMGYDWDRDQKRYPKLSIELALPEGFPDKYRAAIVKAMDQCVVKQHLHNPPEFEITLI
ncbi:MAG: osmotically inducible protein OsmC [Desulfofustis sp.]|nr:OsmC family protein [Desulfofustis sp.]MBT8344959.1 OsmC family protein [Desulfofustis sp.]NNK15006.1 osmotically inducible protein OsmC [Desulfofustis sp.]NNK58220.1 osmotically inducible protein OsmC [Desulfofustis sp.]